MVCCMGPFRLGGPGGVWIYRLWMPPLHLNDQKNTAVLQTQWEAQWGELQWGFYTRSGAASTGTSIFQISGLARLLSM